ncbi:HlyD family efflux transporter periplasmic adaptor subunit [Pseudoalteromonas sp. CO325X]|uniref:efflux RND transporter periplasmic adaptor subunit n=1 Tax=Pseudoalteromonas sp. CO325X TaxID=1777262 RepID=UPI00102301E6|nr:HlyD family efflux transporter periplasmic adaptor subunit [Pseudoalteromonas sp. CO325X]RZF83277.1 HlyD family efflux transporter periplasmic adaptor subunit [Pseudoalteromonas sp. CO325X]
MDKTITKKRTTIRKKLLIGGSLAAIILLTTYTVKSSFETPIKKVEIAGLELATVEVGQLSIEVAGVGTVQPKQRVLHSVLDEGVVAKIIKRAGDYVHTEDVIAVVHNNKIAESIRGLRNKLVLKAAEKRELEVTHRVDQLEITAEIESLKSEVDVTKVVYESQQTLSKSGVISKINLMKAQVELDSKTRKLAFLKSKKEEQRTIHQLKKQNNQVELEQLQAELAALERIEDSLTVKASISGLVLEQELEIGQKIESGAKVAVVGGTHDLLALVKLPQSQAQQITIGMQAKVKLVGANNTEYQAQVVRVEPKVQDGYQFVELAIGEHDNQIFPLQDVHATIELSRAQDSLYVKQPYGAHANKVAKVYVIDSEDKAVLRSVTFGAHSNGYITIKDGLQSDERVIVSNTAHFAGANELKLF